MFAITKSKLKPIINSTSDTEEIYGNISISGGLNINPSADGATIQIGTAGETISASKFVRISNGWIYSSGLGTGISKLEIYDSGGVYIKASGITGDSFSAGSEREISLEIGNSLFTGNLVVSNNLSDEILDVIVSTSANAGTYLAAKVIALTLPEEKDIILIPELKMGDEVYYPKAGKEKTWDYELPVLPGENKIKAQAYIYAKAEGQRLQEALTNLFNEKVDIERTLANGIDPQTREKLLIRRSEIIRHSNLLKKQQNLIRKPIGNLIERVFYGQ